MKIKLWVSAIDLKAFMSGESKTFTAGVYQESPRNVEIEVDISKMKVIPHDYSMYYIISRKSGWKN